MNLSNQRKAERNYYREQFDLHKTDLKRSWNIIKNIINKEDNRRSAKELVFLSISLTEKLLPTLLTITLSMSEALAKNIPT